jgi:hypothetical protein
MPRKEKSTVDYFPHFVNQGQTLFTLEQMFGNDGYGVWFKTLEILGATSKHFLDLKNPITLKYYIAKMRCDEQKVFEILNLLAQINAIDKELWQAGRIIWAVNFVENLQGVYKKRKSEIPSKPVISGTEIPLFDVYPAQKYGLNDISTAEIRQRKGKERKEKERKVEHTSIPPSLDELKAYFNLKNYVNPNIEAEAMFNYYESNGWKVGKNPMKNWKAASANWNKNAKNWNGKINETKDAFEKAKESCNVQDWIEAGMRSLVNSFPYLKINSETLIEYYKELQNINIERDIFELTIKNCKMLDKFPILATLIDSYRRIKAMDTRKRQKNNESDEIAKPEVIRDILKNVLKR